MENSDIFNSATNLATGLLTSLVENQSSAELRNRFKCINLVEKNRRIEQDLEMHLSERKEVDLEHFMCQSWDSLGRNVDGLIFTVSFIYCAESCF